MNMYEKNLNESVHLRLSETDMNFLRSLSAQRGSSVSECIRSIIGEYRRSLDTLEALKEVINLSKGGKLSIGDTKTDINNQL